MAKKTDVQVEIPGINIQMFTVKLVGDSPLIVHAWSEKAKREMLDKQMKKAKAGREAKNPFKDYVDSLYWLTDKPENATQEDIEKAKFGFPAVAFKAAAVDAGYQSGVTANKTTSRGAFHIVGDMVEIEGTPEIREDMVRVGMGTADIRYRGEFKNWSVTLQVRYNANAMSMEQVINLFNLGGFACGIGEWRPAKDGSFGMFHVE
ncbi:hypothetical protein M7775_05685 [Sporomusa sphaeroides DSM 2875]|uniref:hypothetical protein n=1 Tax=Sporomusa sphaeroides TaxID=47679 RepID=UPI00202E4520|nr:hypothetical protein [Sporomusa sphaeroides]MCM0758067.1 hypothetical protein [Sporomusa sphaeroides DSM 2875]